MTDSNGDANRGKSGRTADDATARGLSPVDPPRRSVGLLLPALALVVGLVVGGLFVGLTDMGDSGDQASQVAKAAGSANSTASPSSNSSSSSEMVLTVPQACLDLTDDSQDLLDLVEQAVTAARDLDASGLSAVVSKLQDAQERLRTQTEACRTAATASN